MGQGALGQFSKSPPAPGCFAVRFPDPRSPEGGGLREKRTHTPLPGASACRAQTCPSARPGPKRPGAGLRPLGAENLSSKPRPEREEESPKYGKQGPGPGGGPGPATPAGTWPPLETATPGPGLPAHSLTRAPSSFSVPRGVCRKEEKQRVSPWQGRTVSWCWGGSAGRRRATA